MGVVVVSDFKIGASAFNEWEEQKWTEATLFCKVLDGNAGQQWVIYSKLKHLVIQ